MGHIGVYRDERTLGAARVLCEIAGDRFGSLRFGRRPNVATGGSVKHAIDILKSKGVTDISYVGLVGAPEGVRKIQQSHPDVNIS